MDEGETGTRGVEGARERGCGGEEKRDLSGKSERGRNGDRMREEGTSVRIAGIEDWAIGRAGRLRETLCC